MSELAIQEQPRVLAALSASEMASTQVQLKGWCLQKLKNLAIEYREQRENFTVAKAAKWKFSTWETAMRKTKKKMVFYGKLFAAVKAGYVIVPNFDAEIMAVRVDRDRPRHKGATSDWQVNRAAADALPAGVGRYVDDITCVRDCSYDYGEPGQRKTKAWFTSGEFDDEIDFPIAIVKPIVMDATQRALGLRIFDEVAVAGAAKKDPIVLGRINGINGKVVTFFIAWWLDVNTL